ncbi:MAG: regulatory protein RecX [Candidatus Eremiobacteraeota bacterium]|nr:regulatory protein RecX [Candidatus Eremiobacteraeota bacterium]MBC5828188.1 regulatory protein RecX [Candidatus Eremiobacteraeota bacterium]
MPESTADATDGKLATVAAVRLLSSRRLTKAQLRQKLRERGYASEAIDAAVDECERRRYLDDRTFAQLHIKNALDRKSVGRLRLLRELLHYGVESQLAREVLDELDDDEESRIDRALAKLEAMRPQDRYGQLARRLERLGFSAPDIARALRRRAARGVVGERLDELR